MVSELQGFWTVSIVRTLQNLLEMVCVNFSLLAMACASNPWTAASIQELDATPMSHPL
jgi:hypothetical protein